MSTKNLTVTVYRNAVDRNFYETLMNGNLLIPLAGGALVALAVVIVGLTFMERFRVHRQTEKAVTGILFTVAAAAWAFTTSSLII